MTTTQWFTMASVATLFVVAQPASANNSPHQPTERRIQLSMGIRTPQDSSVMTSAGLRAPQAAMLHHFWIDVVDSTGAALSPAVTWEIEIRLTGYGAGSRVQLTSGMTEFSLPKPLGLRIEPGELIVVTARIKDSDTPAQPVYFQISIGYDAIDAGITRLAVRSVAARGIVGGNSSQTTWEWRAPDNARLLALAGEAISNARDLILEDVASGAVMWRANDRGARLAFGTSNPYVRLGVALLEGRTYRLTAVYAGESIAQGTSVTALALPAQQASQGRGW